MTSRQEAIMEHIVRCYIASGEPVSSLRLAGDFAFSAPGEQSRTTRGERAEPLVVSPSKMLGINRVEPPVVSRVEPLSSAMLRIEMAALEDGGWLEQPYISSGRIPTMKAMRWFAKTLLSEQSPHKIASKSPESTSDLTEHVARSAKTAVAFIVEPKHTVMWSGLHYLAAPEVSEHQLLGECLTILEELARRVEYLFDQIPQGAVLIYVGDENPLVSQPHFSMFMGRIHPKSLEPGVLMLLGPLRMDYANAIGTLKGFLEVYHG